MKTKCFFRVLCITFLSFGNAAFAQTTSSLKEQLVQAHLSPKAWDLMINEVTKKSYPKDYVAITDFTLPSRQPRFFLINLKNKSFQVMNVAHGWNSGGENATCFSNRNNSFQSSLGFVQTVGAAHGAWNPSMILKGLSLSNSNMEERSIILHSADYSSEAFLRANGYWGRSQGCLALPPADIKSVMNSLGSNALILNYHDRLWEQSQKAPDKEACLPGADPHDIPPNDWEITENKMGTAFKSVRSKY